MLKGVNRQVVEISQPESAYFERVLFFVKPEFSSVAEGKLKSKADELIRDASSPPAEKIKNGKKERLKQIFRFLFAAAIGALASGLAFLAG